MSNNIFFDVEEIAEIGSNALIGKTTRIRYPHLTKLSDNIIIDDFVYISTRLVMDKFTHIASGCKLIGGPQSSINFNKFSTIAPNVVIAAGSDDYYDGLASPFIPKKFKASSEYSEIVVPRHCIIGANTTILPNSQIGEGVAVGANSLVKGRLEEWCVYAGCPAVKIGERKKASILEYEKQFLQDFSEKKHISNRVL